MANINYVTGAGGFLGSYLTKIKQLENIVAIPHKKISTTKLKSFDKFFFLSSYGNMFSQTNDHKTIQANLLDLIHILEEAVKHKFESFIYMSSSSVTLPVQSIYSRAKKAAEEILLGYQDKYNLPICIVRPYSITGVGEQPSHLIPTLIRAAYTGETIDFVPEPTHDFIDVEDVANGIFLLSQWRASGIQEIGQGQSYSNQAVLELVQKCTGRVINVNIVKNLRPYDSKEWVADNKRIMSFSKKMLQVSIEEMVKDYEQKNKDISNK